MTGDTKLNNGISETKPCPLCNGIEFHTGIGIDIENQNQDVEAVCCENPDCDWACRYDAFMEWQKS